MRSATPDFVVARQRWPGSTRLHVPDDSSLTDTPSPPTRRAGRWRMCRTPAPPRSTTGSWSASGPAATEGRPATRPPSPVSRPTGSRSRRRRTPRPHRALPALHGRAGQVPRELLVPPPVAHVTARTVQRMARILARLAARPLVSDQSASGGSMSRVAEVQPGIRPPVAEQPGLHVLREERFTRQRVVGQVDLADRHVVRGSSFHRSAQPHRLRALDQSRPLLGQRGRGALPSPVGDSEGHEVRIHGCRWRSAVDIGTPALVIDLDDELARTPPAPRQQRPGR